VLHLDQVKADLQLWEPGIAGGRGKLPSGGSSEMVKTMVNIVKTLVV
jgi:hypothetical protein